MPAIRNTLGGVWYTCPVLAFSDLVQHPHFTNEESEAQKEEATYLSTLSFFFFYLLFWGFDPLGASGERVHESKDFETLTV